MDLSKLVLVIQLITAVLLIVVVLLQNRGTSLGETFGGSGTFFGVRRGIEKTLFNITIILAVIFIGASLVLLFV